MFRQAVGNPRCELLQCYSVQWVGGLKDRGAAAALLGGVHDEHLVITLISEPCCRVRVGGVLPREHSGRDARVDTTDLVKLGAGTIQHGRVDVGLALHDERQFAVLVCVDVHLGALVVLAPSALNHDIVVVLTHDGRIDSIDHCLCHVFIEVAHGCPHLPPCVLLGEVLFVQGCDALHVDAVRFGQVVRGEGRHALVVLLWKVYHRSGEFCQHLIHLVSVDASIHPPHTVRGHLPEVVFQGGDEVVELDRLLEASCLINVGNGETVHCLIVLQPEGGVPGFVVCPTVEGLTLGDHGFECLHRVVCLLVCIVDGDGAMPRKAVPVRRLSQHRSARRRRPEPSGWGRRWSSSRSSYLPPGTLHARRMRYDRHLRWWVCSLHPSHRTYPRQQVELRTCFVCVLCVS